MVLSSSSDREAPDYGGIQKKRIFTLAHFFSGKEDVLGAAIKRLAALDGMTVKTYSFDRKGADSVDLLKEQPYGDILDNCRNGELDPPCGSFSIVRHRPGGPPAVPAWSTSMACQRIHLNSRRRRIKGHCSPSVRLAVRSARLLGEVIQSQRRRHT